jgi:hypothetical protein
VEWIVGDLFHIQEDGGSSRGFGICVHLEFFAGGRLKLSGEEKGRCRNQEEEGMKREMDPHEFLLCRESGGSALEVCYPRRLNLNLVASCCRFSDEKHGMHAVPVFRQLNGRF